MKHYFLKLPPYLLKDSRDVRVLLMVTVLAFFITPSLTLSAQEPVLEDIPFWRMSAGFWVSDNTYFNKSLDYNIRSYNSIVRLELKGRSLQETEYKFYPPGKLAMAYGAGKIASSEGIEVVTITRGDMMDETGSVRVYSISPDFGSQLITRFDVLGRDTAVRISADPAESTDSYRMFITMPVNDKRYVANFGFVDQVGTHLEQAGDLRGFSLFRGDRIRAEDFEDTRIRLRQVNKVAAVVTADAEGKPQVNGLD